MKCCLDHKNLSSIDYLWIKSQGKFMIKHVERSMKKWVHLLIFLTFYSTVTTWKGSRKCHGRVMEKSLNFILGFLYEPCQSIVKSSLETWPIATNGCLSLSNKPLCMGAGSAPNELWPFMLIFAVACNTHSLSVHANPLQPLTGKHNYRLDGILVASISIYQPFY